ncbi:hypothetical protein Q5A_020620 [Serratia inhibens PRI-2C]|nr:hypothetical protein Q5A_020620 [Serratia inhibens PRI-2C]
MNYFPIIITLTFLILSIFLFTRHAKLRNNKKLTASKAKRSRIT